ncbi:MAG: FAD-binding oxidoreductase [Chloroflexi bacterium]|nr:FAD-binding oxidoreductase [Chloroflexota bacterium]
MKNNVFDVILVGGGVMSCASAFYLLKADKKLKVCIVEKDPTYTYASTPLSDGNTRIQFNLKENIQISLFGLDVLASFAEDMAVNGQKLDIAFRRQGNLFLVDEDVRVEAEIGLVLQQSLGCDVKWMTPAEIRQIYPLCEPGGCNGATFGAQDGTMNPWAVLVAYKNKALALGAEYMHAEAETILSEENRVTGIRLVGGETLFAPIVLNGAGAWGAQLALTCGVSLPILPVMRQVFVVETNVRPKGILPGIFFPSGLYCFHERNGQFMIGKSLADDPVGFDFRPNKQAFTDQIWPELVEYLPEFDRLKVTRSWAGLYDVNTLDGNAVLGEWPTLKGFYLANGFSGHGFQQCHAVGRYIAEQMLGMQPVLDLSKFSPERILENKPVAESKARLI